MNIIEFDKEYDSLMLLAYSISITNDPTYSVELYEKVKSFINKNVELKDALQRNLDNWDNLNYISDKPNNIYDVYFHKIINEYNSYINNDIPDVRFMKNDDINNFINL